MKKLIMTIVLALALVLSLGTVAFAGNNGNGNGNGNANGNSGNANGNSGNNAKSVNAPAPTAAPTQTIYLKGSGGSFDASSWQNPFFAAGATTANQCWHLVYSGKNIGQVTSMQIKFVDKNGGQATAVFNWTQGMGFSSNGGGNNLGWIIFAPDNFKIAYVDKGNNNQSESFLVTAETGNPQFNISGYKAGSGVAPYVAPKCGAVSVSADDPVVLTHYFVNTWTVTYSTTSNQNDDAQGDEPDTSRSNWTHVSWHEDSSVPTVDSADFAGTLSMEIWQDGTLIWSGPLGTFGDPAADQPGNLEPGDYTINLLADGDVIATQDNVTVVAGGTTTVHFDSVEINKDGTNITIINYNWVPTSGGGDQGENNDDQ